MNNTIFQTFFNLLDTHEFSLQEQELVIALEQGYEKGKYQKILEDLGYEFDVRTIRHGNLHISLLAPCWNRECPLFVTWNALFTRVSDTSKLLDFFYVLEEKSSSFDKHELHLSLKLFIQTRRLLASLSDHCEPRDGIGKGSKKLFFIIETDDSVAKYEFSPLVDWPTLEKIPDVSNQLGLVDKLINLIAMGDSQDVERRSVMRSAFNEVISVCHNNNEIFHKIINSITHFHRRYEEHYELFVKRFSVNKVLHEINEQDLTYTSKINEIISSAQNKALAIPVALIAIGAVMKIDHFVDGIAVAVGMLITTIIVHRSLNVHIATFTHIKRQVNSEFKRYDILNEDVEIRRQATSTNTDLSYLLDKANANSCFMKRSIWFIFIASLAFIIFVSCNAHTNKKTPQNHADSFPSHNKVEYTEQPKVSLDSQTSVVKIVSKPIAKESIQLNSKSK